jgi:hypothetical protein
MIAQSSSAAGNPPLAPAALDAQFLMACTGARILPPRATNSLMRFTTSVRAS